MNEQRLPDALLRNSTVCKTESYAHALILNSTRKLSTSAHIETHFKPVPLS
eukprot:CAMPEP_0173118232 /NCGR_PEP_ID=MMETSP1102-20130122/50849_1 /TAXON_ID=49646 /ORGANISM="Geminigera sp., Strain Caron Lab Isolate" /LENGTH=50 /DNA_ID=CAMNT_0014023171 /DNA_START=56 /DNA_END=205 /DNA_ORIENTATION=+